MKRYIPFIILALAAVVFMSFSLPTEASTASGQDLTRVIVEYKPGQKNSVEKTIGAAAGEFHYTFDELHSFAVTIPANAIEGLNRNPNVVSIEPDAPRYLFGDGETIPWGIDATQARSVWDSDQDGVIDSGAPTGEGTLICVIDSGLKTDHADFAGVNVVGGYPNGWNTDTCGHGTHVAGTIAAASNNIGVVGVTPGATSLYIMKVFDGPDCGWSYSSDLVSAANQCAAVGADVISMSLGGAFKSRLEENAFANLYDQGILSVAAAGNDGNTRMSYPASYPDVMSVAAVDENLIVAEFSQQNSAVEISAPGVGVLSTVPWLSSNSLTVDGVIYDANHIEFAAYENANGAVVDGGLCTSTGAWSGSVVLCERGDISFYDKVMNVQNSGGAAAVIYNNEPGNFLGTLGDGASSTIPAISISQEDGAYLMNNKLGQTGFVQSGFDENGSGYESWDGTSMATPHISGIAALLWSSDFSLSNTDVRNAITSTALDLGAAGRDNAYGFGFVQAYDAWQSLGGGIDPTPTPTATPTDTPEPTPTPDGTMHVGNIFMFSDKRGVNRIVYTEVSIVDQSGVPIPEVSVDLEMTLPDGTLTSGTALTGADGTVEFSYKSKQTGLYTSEVVNVTNDLYVYDPASNIETSESLIVD